MSYNYHNSRFYLLFVLPILLLTPYSNINAAQQPKKRWNMLVAYKQEEDPDTVKKPQKDKNKKDQYVPEAEEFFDKPYKRNSGIPKDEEEKKKPVKDDEDEIDTEKSDKANSKEDVDSKKSSKERNNINEEDVDSKKSSKERNNINEEKIDNDEAEDIDLAENNQKKIQTTNNTKESKNNNITESVKVVEDVDDNDIKQPSGSMLSKDVVVVKFVKKTTNIGSVKKLPQDVSSTNNTVKKKEYYMEYVAQADTTVSAIADEIKMKNVDFATAAGLQNDATILKSTKIYIPIKGYTIKAGDTLLGIASTFDTTLSQIINVNPDLKNPNHILVGKGIGLPIFDDTRPKVIIVSDRSKKKEEVSTTATKPTITQTVSPTKAKQAQKMSTETSSLNKVEKKVVKNDNDSNVSSTKAGVNANTSVKATATSNTSVSKFTWPVRSPNSFKYNISGEEGILVETNKGSDVVATRDGVVAYVGNKIAKYGELLVIKHDDNYMSLYGHINANVQKGDTVVAGQVIAKAIGSTEYSDKKNVYIMFSIRHDRRIVDVATYLPPLRD